MAGDRYRATVTRALEHVAAGLTETRYAAATVIEGRQHQAADPQAGRHVLTMGLGVDEWAGEWKLRIGELVGFDEEGGQIRISGPWEFTFSVP